MVQACNGILNFGLSKALRWLMGPYGDLRLGGGTELPCSALQIEKKSSKKAQTINLSAAGAQRGAS